MGIHHSARMGIHTPYGLAERSFRNQSEASEEAALSRQVVLYCLLSPGSFWHACRILLNSPLLTKKVACMPVLCWLAPALDAQCIRRCLAVAFPR